MSQDNGKNNDVMTGMSTSISIFGIGNGRVPAGMSKDERIAALEREVKNFVAAVAMLNSQPAVLAYVVGLRERNGQRLLLISAGNGQVFEKNLPSWAADVRVGMTVRCIQGPLDPIEFDDAPPTKGLVVTVDRVHPGLVEFAGGQLVPCGFSVAPGDRVVLAPTGEVVTRALGPAGATRGEIVVVDGARDGNGRRLAL